MHRKQVLMIEFIAGIDEKGNILYHRVLYPGIASLPFSSICDGALALANLYRIPVHAVFLRESYSLTKKL